jgi:hypothetical protein
LVLLGFGVRYFFAGQLMPYHAETTGANWDSLAAGYQIVFLTLYRATGAGMLATGVAVLVILLLPYRLGQPWSRWALSGIGIFYGIMSSYLTLAYQGETSANVPWQGPVASVFVVIVAHFLWSPSTHNDDASVG